MAGGSESRPPARPISNAGSVLDLDGPALDQATMESTSIGSTWKGSTSYGSTSKASELHGGLVLDERLGPRRRASSPRRAPRRRPARPPRRPPPAHPRTGSPAGSGARVAGEVVALDLEVVGPRLVGIADHPDDLRELVAARSAVGFAHPVELADLLAHHLGHRVDEQGRGLLRGRREVLRRVLLAEHLAERVLASRRCSACCARAFSGWPVSSLRQLELLVVERLRQRERGVGRARGT